MEWWLKVYYSSLRIQAYSLLYKDGHYSGDLDIKHLLEEELASISKAVEQIKEGE